MLNLRIEGMIRIQRTVEIRFFTGDVIDGLR
jgi:hypothetical protein